MTRCSPSGLIKMIINEKPLSTLLKAMRQQRVVRFERLTSRDIPKISSFLNAIWTQLYGKTGSPVFHEDYLHWVFGGPNKDKNLLFGAMQDNELIAYQSLLYRKMLCCGKEMNSFLNTHLAVSPRLDLRLRMDCMFQLAEQTIVFHPESEYYTPDCDLMFAFVEEDKSLKSFGDKFTSKYFQVERKTCATFNQCILAPSKLKKYLHENQMGKNTAVVRPATDSDSFQLARLFNQMPDNPHLIVTMTEHEIGHYCFGHPDHRTFVAECGGEIQAFINYYPLETIRDGKTHLYIIIDFLIADRLQKDDSTSLALLLQEAIRYSEETKARGIVFENATYLDYEKYQPLGLTPSFRKMHMVLATKDSNFNYAGAFRCDVK
jgi:hypothetical protein